MTERFVAEETQEKWKDERKEHREKPTPPCCRPEEINVTRQNTKREKINRKREKKERRRRVEHQKKELGNYSKEGTLFFQENTGKGLGEHVCNHVLG